ncbi:MAG TPA: hypothetical protein VGV38_22005, partial [Pyrinomonadaceae bacterium]|nr:hypothetical protein [Pyrinomonadaceae bacterium]
MPRRKPALCAAVLCAVLCLATFAAAQTGVEHLDTREALVAASERLSTIDFNSVAPARGFGKYRPEEGLAVGGVMFRAHGGARFGPGLIYVVSSHYGGSNPLHNTGMLPHLSWGAPNQPGNAALDVTPPAGTTALGCDLWTQQPYVGTVEVTATTDDGLTQTVVVATRARPAGSFVGFISERPIVSVSFRPPKGQTGLLLDNFSFGRKAQGRRVRASVSNAAPVRAGEDASATRAEPTPAQTDARPPATQAGIQP